MLSELPVNKLFEKLPHTKREKLITLCEKVELELGATLCEPGKNFQYVYFPITGLISLVKRVGFHPSVEIGLIGVEGMLGATIQLGVNTAPLKGVVQGYGYALRLPIKSFIQELSENPALKKILNRYLYSFIGEISQSIACIHFHEVESRLARWLLTAHDRVQADNFHFTHQNLANALGVQRSAVTIAAGVLQKRKLIRYIRGDIRILNRKGLESASCECYRCIYGANLKR